MPGSLRYAPATFPLPGTSVGANSQLSFFRMRTQDRLFKSRLTQGLYFLRPVVSAAPFGHAGLTNSVRHIGPPSYKGPSVFTTEGHSPRSIHTCRSGGCLPINGATTPFTPPIFTFTTYRVALRVTPPVVNGSSPSALMASFTSRGFGVATTMGTVKAGWSPPRFLSRI